MKGIKVIITKDSPNFGYGCFKKGDTGVVVGFTQGCAVVVKNNDDKFVRVELRDLKKLK